MSTPGAPPVALVTGAGSGIGAAVAIALAGAGYQLVLAGRRKTALETTGERIISQGGKAMSVVADVVDPASVGSLFGAIENAFGRLDLLFNNAGVNAPAVSIDELPLEDWRRVIDTNLNGAFYCAREAFGLMKRQTPRGGRIINNGSISAQVPRPLSAPYAASKHAITGLTRALALDGRQFDIACGQIDIGNVATSFTDRMARGVLQADGRMAPEPRMDLADVCRAILAMAQMPLSANVLFMTVMATKMPFVGRG